MKGDEELVQCQFVFIREVINCEIFGNIALQFICKSSVSLAETNEFH